MTIEAPPVVRESPRRGGRPRLDLTGQTFGRLTVLSMLPPAPHSAHSRALVRCECGVEKTLQSRHLRGGCTLSCGCLRREIAAGKGRAMRGKFVTTTPTYAAAHDRVRSARGKASEHTCSCGAQAAQWAYNHADPNEFKEAQPDSQTGRVYVVPYSGDPSFYDALCLSCHRNRDHAHSKESK